MRQRLEHLERLEKCRLFPSVLGEPQRLEKNPPLGGSFHSKRPPMDNSTQAGGGGERCNPQPTRPPFINGNK